MATMKDIVKLAGISQGTVSNVLNNRGNVSAEKIKLVKQAAKQLGYTLNAHAQQLRSSSGLSNTVAVILPNVIEYRYSALFTAVQKRLQNLNYNVLLFVTDDSPYTEELALNTIITVRACGVISVTCCSDILDIYNMVEQLGSKLIFVERKPQVPRHFVGFDYYLAGYDLGVKLAQNNYSQIGIIMGLDFFTNETDFARGIQNSLSACQSSKFSIRTINTSYASSVKSSFELISQKPVPDVIVTSSQDFCESAMWACTTVLSGDCPPIYSLTQRTINAENQTVIQYYLDYTALGQEISNQLNRLLNDDSQDAEDFITTTLPSKGFIQNSFSFVTHKKTVLNVLLASSSSASALMTITPEFTKKTNIDVNFVTLSLAELTDNLVQMPYNEYFDVIRTNVTTTPSFPPNALLPIDTKVFQALTENMLQKPTTSLSMICGVPYAVPFDLGIHFLVYRRDLFSDSMLQRIFFESFKRELEIPKTYDEFNEISRFFTKSFNQDSPVVYGTTSILNENTSIVYDFYRRYKSLGGRFFDQKGNCCFSCELATSAIETYCQMLPYSIQSEDATRRDTPIVNFATGMTALEIISTSYASLLVDLKKNLIRGRIGFSEIPGAVSYLGGGALAIPSSCKQPEVALSFIQWACGKDQAHLFTLLGGVSPHKHIYTNSEILQLYPWFDRIPKLVEVSEYDFELDFLNRYKFECLIGRHLRNVYHGAITADMAADIIKNSIHSCQL